MEERKLLLRIFQNSRLFYPKCKLPDKTNLYKDLALFYQNESIMKKLLLLLAFVIFGSCQEEGELTRSVGDTVISQNAILRYYGTFEPTNGITVSGEAKIYQEGNQFKVRLDNFSISSGPDLKVYLSKSNVPSEFVNLGNLTSQTVYPIPPSVNVADYSHVLIHCQQYGHLYAIAPLTQN